MASSMNELDSVKCPYIVIIFCFVNVHRAIMLVLLYMFDQIPTVICSCSAVGFCNVIISVVRSPDVMTTPGHPGNLYQ